MLDTKGMTQLLTALGEPTRLEIIDHLARRGEMNVGELSGKFRVSRPTISHHLKILKDAGILLYEKRGQETYYWVAKEYLIGGLQNIVDTLQRCWVVDEGGK